MTTTPVMRCRLCSENEDKKCMETCKIILSTSAFVGGDDLYQPIRMSSASFNKLASICKLFDLFTHGHFYGVLTFLLPFQICYVTFCDEITLAMQEAQRQKFGADHYVKKWCIIMVKTLPFVGQQLNGKIPKMRARHQLPSSRYSIWVDLKYQYRSDPFAIFEALLWLSTSVLHGVGYGVYADVKKNKATPEGVEVW
ncbi:hypothetical protein Cgig2_004512 [Carnegiea gigantea]|uniref:TOD1/MUCI70 glycosyltransferase-like domain-containing protein n=1 Tax=Carnegiea gigantea TaxID=171969 RepID=A0A9Q1QDQ6_9CARY|nr:hypothetical protein Cgig2_004512 [Carnegiea gigantea]